MRHGKSGYDTAQPAPEHNGRKCSVRSTTCSLVNSPFGGKIAVKKWEMPERLRSCADIKKSSLQQSSAKRSAADADAAGLVLGSGGRCPRSRTKAPVSRPLVCEPVLVQRREPIGTQLAFQRLDLLSV